MKLFKSNQPAQQAPQDQSAWTDGPLEMGPAPTPGSARQQGRRQQKKKRPFIIRLFSWFIGFIFTCFILGTAGLAALYVWVSEDLPDLSKITEFKAPQATVIYARDGSPLGTLSHEKRFVITLSEMPKYLPMAFLAIEDSAFYEHPGINPLAIVRAMIVNFERGTKSQGGSTITQQIVKQMLLSSERSYVRKMKEAVLATRLERELSKDQILALYLNYIYLGQHSYGVEAASRTYFGKHAADLSLAEAAVIAGMPQAPSKYNPMRKPRAAKNRQMEVLGRLRTLQWISEDEYQKAANEPLVYWSSQELVSGPAEWYFEEARRLLVEFFTESTLKALGLDTSRTGEDFVYEAGLTVQTAMDPYQQQLAGEALRRGLENVDRRQGWHGPVQHLSSQEEYRSYLEKQDFDIDFFAEGEWAQGVVTKVTGKDIRVDLGKGFTGVIPISDISWARHTSPLARNVKSGRVVTEGDVIWVSAAIKKNDEKKETPAKKSSKETKAPVQLVDTAPAFVPGKDIPLHLRQDPLVQGALVSIEPQSGDVVALIGGFQFGNSHFNRATQARRQPGSSFKPVVYSTALDNGFTPFSPVLDGPIEFVNPYTHKVWRPSGSDHFKGEMPLYSALAQSRNTPTVRIAQKVGVDKIIQRAADLGLEPKFPRELSICLGAVAVSPLNMAQAYCAFANNGLGVRPRIITSIKDSKGRELYRQDVEHWQAISPQTAFQMDCLLKGVVNHGTGSRARIEGRNIAGKTGTSNDSNDLWFVGFTPYLCTAVYVGYDQMHSLGKQEQGGRTSAPIFRDYRVRADEAYNDQPQDFTMPPGIVMQDGQAFKGSVSAGVSAMDGRASSAESQQEEAGSAPVNSGQAGEDLMREMF